MSSPNDPPPPSQWPPPAGDPYQQQPYQGSYPQYGQYPAYPQQYGQYPQYGQYGGWPQQPATPPKRPGTLIAAGIMWVLFGGIALLLGVVGLVADQLPTIDEVYADNPDITPQMLRDFGIWSTSAGVVFVGLGIMVFTGALWARIAIAVVGGVVALLTIFTVVIPLLVVLAIVLQFLPASNAYDKAKRARTA